MILLPVGDENPRLRIPVVHYFIIAANVLVFLYVLMLPPDLQTSVVSTYGILRSDFHPYQLLTSLFLHAGLIHLFFNMLFLWIVGDNVEDRLGHIGYLLFYLGVGVAAGFSFLSLSTASEPCIGASGAISGVMAAYVVFFPNARIRFFYFFWFLFNTIYVSAKWAIGLWFAQQILLYLVARSFTNTAFEAHVGGFLVGLFVALAFRPFLRPDDSVARILGTERAPDQSDDWFRPRQSSPDALGWPRFEQSSPEHLGWPASTSTPAPVDLQPVPTEPVHVEPESEPLPPPPSPSVSPDLRNALGAALADGRDDEAFRLYERLASFGPASVDPEILLALANLLVDRSEYDRAARVYDDYLKLYPEADQVPEAAFRVGMIHARTTRDYVRARSRLDLAANRHPNPARRARALDEIRRVDSFLRATFVGKARPEGLCTIIRQTDRHISVSQVSDLVARATGLPVADVSRRILTSHGILAEHLSAPRAFRLAEDIQALDVPVLVISDADLVTLPPPQDVRQVHLSPAGVRFDLARDAYVAKSWDQIDLLSVGLLPGAHKVSHEITHPRRYYRGAPTEDLENPDEIVTSEETQLLVMDVFLLSDAPPLHLRARSGSFRCHLDDGSSHDTRDRQFASFLNTLFEHAPSLVANIGAHHEASDSHASRRDYTFQNIETFNEYNRWLLTLSRFQPRSGVLFKRSSTQ